MNKTRWKSLISVLLIFALIFNSTATATAATNSSNATYKSTAISMDASSVGQLILKQVINDAKLKFNGSNDTLLITNAGPLKINNKTTEGSLESIMRLTSSLKYGQVISYGKANIIPISGTTGPLQFTFITKQANGNLMAKKFTITEKGTTYNTATSKTVSINANKITDKQWNESIKELGSNSFNLMSIANAWANGAPMDLLAHSETTKKISYGTISGYVMAKSMLYNYGPDSIHEYVILTTPGGGDDDAPYYLMPWNYKYNAVKGDNPLESAYIYWHTVSKTGHLALMKFNTDLFSQFKEKTGLTVTAGTRNEIKFTTWVLSFLDADPKNIVRVEKSVKINQTNLNYLYGSNNTVGAGISTKGRNYIMQLTDTKSFQIFVEITSSNYTKMKAIGAEMAKHSKTVLNSLPNSDGSQIAVQTAPVYATVMGNLILGFYDGITGQLKTYDPNNLLGIANPYNYESYLNSKLVAVFMQRVGVDSAGNNLVNSLEAIYEFATGKITYSYPILVLSNETYIKYVENGNNTYILSDSYIPMANMFSDSEFWNMPAWMRTAQLWGSNVTYDYLHTWTKTPCVCWTPGLSLFSNYAQSLLPLNTNEQYMITGVPYDNAVDQYSSFELAKSVSVIQNAFDVSTSTGTFSPTQLPDGTVIISAYNTVTKTYRTIIMNLNDIASYFRSDVIAQAKSQDPNYSSLSDIEFLSLVLAGKASVTINDLGQSSFSTTAVDGLTSKELQALVDAFSISKENGFKWLADYQAGRQNNNTDGNSQNNNTTTNTRTNSSSSSDGNSGGLSPGTNEGTPPGSNAQDSSEGQSSGSAEAYAVAESAGESGSDQKSYEVTTDVQKGGSKSETPLIATIGVLMLLLLVGVGYYFKR